jgi:hypothetical protein
MIGGIDTFRNYFRDYKEQYVLIGGAACDIIFDEIDTAFRITKDLDIVLIVETLTPEFGIQLWKFINDGGYENKAKSNGMPQFFRFDKPKNSAFPYMIELLSRTEGFFVDDEPTIVPIPIDDSISSLSAILLNHDYYKMLFTGHEEISDIVVLSPIYLIPFKAKAWLDLTERKLKGEHVNTRDISKHANDVVRLATIISRTEKVLLPTAVLDDMSEFIRKFEENPIDPKNIKIKGISADDILTVLKNVYL